MPRYVILTRTKLHRQKFAKHLAESILKIDSSDGFVFALTGPWGSGKTTMLNFMENVLKEQAKKREDRLVVVLFNAWWISGSDRFLQHFFKQFQSPFYRKRWGGRFKDFFTKFSPALKPLPKIGLYAAALEALLKATKRSHINELRQKVDDDLRNFPGRILVIIDDVDRLRPDEIRLVFRLVKTVANFPNTIYILAYDEPVVAKAVGDGDQQAGREYLNKIVQLPLTLPMPDRSNLQELFSEGLETIIENTSETPFDRTYFSTFYSDTISHFLTTPRNVVRFLNLLRATYPLVEREVNAVDFISIQALRQFAPAVYAFVPQNKDLFCYGKRTDMNSQVRSYTEEGAENDLKYMQGALSLQWRAIGKESEGLLNRRCGTS